MKLLVPALSFASLFAMAAPARAIDAATDRVLTFDPPDARAWTYRPYLQTGNFVITTNAIEHSLPDTVFSRVDIKGADDAGEPSNGGNYLLANSYDDAIIVWHRDHRPFDVRQVDLSEYRPDFGERNSITFVGYHSDGTSVTQTFVTDGAYDGTGPLADFEPFTFSGDFQNIVRLVARSASFEPFAMDNLALTVHGQESSPRPAPLNPVLFQVDWNDDANPIGAPAAVMQGAYAPSEVTFGVARVRSAVGALTDRPLELIGEGQEGLIFSYGQLEFDITKPHSVYQLEFDITQTDTDTLVVFFDASNNLTRFDIGEKLDGYSYDRHAANKVRVVYDLGRHIYTIYLNGRLLGSKAIWSIINDVREIRFSLDDVDHDGGTAIDNVRISGFDETPPDTLRGPISNPANGHDYYLLDASSWTTARAAAFALGGDLAQVGDALEDAWIQNTFFGAGRLWLGLSRPSGGFEWPDTTAPGYTNWAAAEPAAAGGNFVYTHASIETEAGKWAVTTDLAAGARAVVETPAEPTPTPPPVGPVTPPILDPEPATTPPPMPGINHVTDITMTSEPGDPIGQGRTYNFPAGSGTFRADSDSNHVTISFYSPDYREKWALSFTPPNGDFYLPVGTYTNATKNPTSFSDASMVVYGDGRGPETLTGKFTVKQSTWSPAKLVSFWATFEQYADGSASPLRGEVRYNVFVPPPPTPTPLPTATSTPTPTPTPRPTATPTPTPRPFPIPTPTPRPTATPTPAPTAAPTPFPTPLPVPMPPPDRVPPRLALYGPAYRVTASAHAAIGGLATDNHAVASIEFKAPGRSWRPLPGNRLWYVLADIAPGPNAFLIRATDSSGNRSKNLRVVVVRQ